MIDTTAETIRVTWPLGPNCTQCLELPVGALLPESVRRRIERLEAEVRDLRQQIERARDQPC